MFGYFSCLLSYNWVHQLLVNITAIIIPVISIALIIIIIIVVIVVIVAAVHQSTAALRLYNKTNLKYRGYFSYNGRDHHHDAVRCPLQNKLLWNRL